MTSWDSRKWGSEVLVPDTVPKNQRDWPTSSIGQAHLPQGKKGPGLPGSEDWQNSHLESDASYLAIFRFPLCQVQVLGNSFKLVLRLFLLSCLKVRILSQGNHNLEFWKTFWIFLSQPLEGKQKKHILHLAREHRSWVQCQMWKP